MTHEPYAVGAVVYGGTITPEEVYANNGDDRSLNSLKRLAKRPHRDCWRMKP